MRFPTTRFVEGNAEIFVGRSVGDDALAKLEDKGLRRFLRGAGKADDVAFRNIEVDTPAERPVEDDTKSASERFIARDTTATRPQGNVVGEECDIHEAFEKG